MTGTPENFLGALFARRTGIITLLLRFKVTRFTSCFHIHDEIFTLPYKIKGRVNFNSATFVTCQRFKSTSSSEFNSLVETPVSHVPDRLFFLENRDYISHKFLVVYISKLTKIILKVKQITSKSLQVSPGCLRRRRSKLPPMKPITFPTKDIRNFHWHHKQHIGDTNMLCDR